MKISKAFPLGFVLFFSFLLSSISAFSQTYSIKKYNVDNGLSQSYVQAVLQDKKGFMWLGTADGLSRFDGLNFKIYTKKSGLSENRIYSSYMDPAGKLWFGHGNGDISIYDAEKDSFNVLNPQILNNKNAVFMMFEDKKGILWMATLGNGVLLYDRKTGKQVKLNDTLDYKIVTKISEDKEGNIWMGTDGGVIVYNGKSFIRMKGMSQSLVLSVHVDTKGNLWVGSQKDGLTVIPKKYLKEIIESNYGPDKIKEISKTVDIPNAKIGNYAQCIFEDSEGTVWVGTRLGGVLKFILTRNSPFDGYFRSYDTKNGLSHDYVWSIAEDREKSMWFGTLGGGVSQLRRNDERFELYDTDEGLPDNNIWSIYQDRNDNVWVGSDGGLTNASVTPDGTLKHFKNYTTKNGLLSNHVQSIYQDSKGTLLAAYGESFEGMGKIALGSTKIENLYQDKKIQISSIVEDSKHNLYIGSYNILGILRYNPLTKETFHFNTNNGLKSNSVCALYKDKKDNIWVGTQSGGLSRIAGNSIQTYGKQQGLKHDTVYCITSDKNSNIWIGTLGGGIYKFNGKTFTNYSLKQGLSSDIVWSIICDDKNNIWMGTSSGIDKFDQKTNTFKHYGKQDGFTGVETNLNAVFKDVRGNLWFGTINGLIKYNPAKDLPNTVEPLTYITGLEVFKKKTPFPADNTFSYKQSHLTFNFVGVSLTIPEKNAYKYKLEGFDSDWSPITSRPDVTYSNLSPGKYTFMVKACSGEGVWNSVPVEYHFEITPPFWQTLWFYALAIIVVLGGLYAFVVLRTRNLQRAKLLLEQQVEERTAEVVLQKEEIEMQKVIVDRKNDELGQKNKDITDSIKYAKRIQEAILPPKELIYSKFPESFIIYKPKDIVSGDFYWYTEKQDIVMMSVADCTGHGVPGAFMSILGNTALNEIVNEKNIYNPNEVLESLNVSVTKTLKQTSGEDKETRDGMDISFAMVDLKKKELNYAGANRPMFFIRNGQLEELKGDSFPIGGHYEDQKVFTKKTQSIEPGDTIYIFSDGVVDQFGGPNGKKFMTKNLKTILLSIQSLTMAEQEVHLRKAIEDWMGELEQIDDILMMGVRF